MLAMARRSELEGRLVAILDPAAPRAALRRARVGQALAVVLVFAAVLTGFRPVARKHTVTVDLRTPPARVDAPARVEAPDPASPEVALLIDVTRAAKKMTSDHEKSQLLSDIAAHFIDDEALTEAYLDVASSITSAHEHKEALMALLEQASFSPRTLVQLLKNTETITSDVERAAVLSEVLQSQTLSRSAKVQLLHSTQTLSSNVEKANVLQLFGTEQGVEEDDVRRAFVDAAKTLTSDVEYRRAMSAVLR